MFPAVLNFFTVGPSWLFRYHLIYAILFTLLFLLVWAVFGGAICRIAAVHVARDEKISVRQALRFSVSKVLSFVFAPVIPLLIVLGIGVVLAVGGLLFYLPWGIGSIVASALMIFAFLGGLVITLVLFGTVGGLNLMYPTIAVEGSDSFDAISRSFSYVFARPWRMLFYTAVAVAYGALAYLFVKFFAYVVLASTHYFVGWWLGGQPGRWYPEMWPAPELRQPPLQPRPRRAGLAGGGRGGPHLDLRLPDRFARRRVRDQLLLLGQHDHLLPDAPRGGRDGAGGRVRRGGRRRPGRHGAGRAGDRRDRDHDVLGHGRRYPEPPPLPARPPPPAAASAGPPAPARRAGRAARCVYRSRDG